MEASSCATTDNNGRASTARAQDDVMSLREQGNAEFRKGNYLRAAALYSRGIKAEPENWTLLCNRSAALLHLNKYSRALSDAEECIRLNPDWDKGYFRRAAALEAMGKMQEALESYKQASETAENGKNRAALDKVRLLQKLVRQKEREKAAGYT